MREPIDLARLRNDYQSAGLDPTDLTDHPVELWRRWLADAEAAGIAEINAMVVSTVDADGTPSSRTVLCKGADETGFVFFTNYESRKGNALASEPRISLLFPWHPLARQVIVAGVAERVSEADSAAYFASRPRGSQLGAWASQQSAVVASRDQLEQRMAELTAEYDGRDVPCPPFWGGYLVRPATVEFWQGRHDRLHDRLRYVAQGDGWAGRETESVTAGPTQASDAELAAPRPPLWRRVAADVTPLRESADYRRWWGGYMVSNVGSQLTIVAAQLQVFHLTHSSFDVGITGLVTVIPLITFGLLGGSIADAIDRRRLMLTTSTILTLLSALLAVQAGFAVDRLSVIYVLVGAQAGVFSIDASARGAMLPRLVRRDLLPAANSLGQISQNTALTAGPLLAGLIVGTLGYSYAFGLDALSFLVILYVLVQLPPVPPEGGGQRAGLKSVAEGLRFLVPRKNLMMTFLVDLNAMVFGMPRALFPALAVGAFHGGSGTAGLLYAAPSAGALLGAGLSGWSGRVRRQGLAVLVAVAVWGASIAAFGFAHELWFGLAMLAVAGAADMVSAIFRSTILQVATPDSLRGRLQGVFIVVVAGGPRFGDVESGTVATLVSTEFAVVSGGLACLVGLIALTAKYRSFAQYDALDPVA